MGRAFQQKKFVRFFAKNVEFLCQSLTKDCDGVGGMPSRRIPGLSPGLSLGPPPGLLLPALALALVAGLGGCSTTETADPSTVTVTPERPVIQPGRPGEANTTHTGPVAVSAPQDNDADARFMAEMILHHAQALQMVELSRDGLEDEEVRALAGRVEAAQLPEVHVMATWLVAHDRPVPREAVDLGVDVRGMGGTVAGGIEGGGGHSHGAGGDHAGMPGMATGAELDALVGASGHEADLLFLELMTRHHEGALEMAGVHGAEGIDERAIELSTGIHAEQAVEIDRMAQLRERLTG